MKIILATILLMTPIAFSSACSDEGTNNNTNNGTTADMGQSDGDTPSNFRLSVTKVGDGSVISSPSGIDCGTNCERDFPAGSTILCTTSTKHVIDNKKTIR